MYVDLIQSGEGMNREKRLISGERGISSCLTAFELGHRFFLAFGLKLEDLCESQIH